MNFDVVVVILHVMNLTAEDAFDADKCTEGVNVGVASLLILFPAIPITSLEGKGIFPTLVVMATVQFLCKMSQV